MKRIGLIVQDLNSDYVTEILDGAKKFCNENDITLLTFIIRTKHWPYGIYDYQHYACKSLITKNNLDGILLISTTYLYYLENEEEKKLELESLCNVPIVSIGENIDGIPSVTTNCKTGIKTILNYLADVKHCKNIAFMTPHPDCEDIAVRKDGYMEFLAERNIPFDESKFFYADFTMEEAVDALKAKNITKENLNFDALVVCGDDEAFGCIEYLNSQGIKVPEDVLVSGFDNQKKCEFSNPSLTSIDQKLSSQGYEAAKLLYQKICHPKSKIKNVSIDSMPVLRKSTRDEDDVRNRNRSNMSWYQDAEELTSFSFYLQSLQTCITEDQLKNHIIDRLTKIGIEDGVLCTYDKPLTLAPNEEFDMPKKANVFFTFSNHKRVTDFDNTEISPTKQMYPEGWKYNKSKPVIAIAIFNTSFQYGYILITPGESCNYRLYELAMYATAIALESNRTFTTIQKESELLEYTNINLKNLSITDEMTKVLNSRGFYEYGQKAIEIAIGTEREGAVIFGDMNGLKKINDTYGHDAGDRAIQAEVQILKSVFRDSDILGRLGGDEFAIVAIGLKEKGFDRIRTALDQATTEYNKTSNEPFTVSISLGFATITKEKNDLKVLLKEADKKQYEEKKQYHKEHK